MSIADADVLLSEVRAKLLAEYPLLPLISAKVREDFLAGKCQLRVHEGTPIIDYRQSRTHAENLCRHGYEWPNCIYCHCIKRESAFTSFYAPGGIHWID